MATAMEVTAVTEKGIAPVVAVKSFLPEPVVAELDEEDLYTRQKLLQRQLEFVDIQEEYIKDEQKNLKRELLRAQEEDIGGCDIQKQEIREAVELPLTHHELYKQIGIDPPRGVLLYGPPGTGKTMLAKAVAHHTTAAFIRVVGSEFVQKYLGEGPRMVRDVFRLAKENAPAIIFIDEIDAIATARFDAQTGADREVQRILMELLNQMDGFDQTVNVKVIMATNRADTLDPALLRPGRLDRKIEFPLPDRRQKRMVFQVCTAKMNLSEEVDLEDYVSRPDKISAAEISAICQEAGMHAVRKNRYVILPKDFEKGYRSNVKKSDTDFEFYR
uniref:AAA+ ATPase domain-containing protein n=1 Tax=Physcomitrium patens TaxID=3218 RepID=A0A7I4D2L4_PHYPA